jgi:DNA-binding transcriptional regulator GbsR (MarR family)
MDNDVKEVEGFPDLVKDMKTGAVINTNHSAYAAARKRAAAAQAQRDEIRNTTREINNLKCEMHEIKNLLNQLVESKQ